MKKFIFYFSKGPFRGFVCTYMLHVLTIVIERVHYAYSKYKKLTLKGVIEIYSVMAIKRRMGKQWKIKGTNGFER